MVETTYQKYRHVSFDRCYLLLDEDVAISQQVRDKARKWHIQLVISTPHCLEGMLLDVLGRAIPHDSQSCKQRLHPLLSGPPVAPASYQKVFAKPVLDTTTKEQIVTLRAVIANNNM